MYLSSMACLTEPDGKIRLAALYQAKILRKNLDSEIKARDAMNLIKCFTVLLLKMWKQVAFKYSLSASMVRNRLMDVMMKILLPACFIAFKLTGSFIDFMLGLANTNVQENIDLVTSQVRVSRTVNHGAYRADLELVRLQIS